MRSEKINPLFKPISSLQGVGPKLEAVLNRLLSGGKIINLLWHIPYNIIKRNKHENLSLEIIDTVITIKVKVISHKPSFYKKQPYKVNCICSSTPIDIIFFNARTPIIKNSLPVNSEKYISGKLEYYKNNYQITHPSYIINIEDIKSMNDLEPIYGLTSGISQKVISKTVNKILPFIPDLNEWIDEEAIKKYSFDSWKNSLLALHNPKNYNQISIRNVFRKRLAYDELLAHQLSISLIKKFNQKHKGIKIIKQKKFFNNFINSLNFKLTNSQKIVIDEISQDLNSENQMIRLLQGDVGSGKTVVALSAIIQTIYSGYQAAIMVPTSILANQHYNNIINLLKNTNISICILTSKDKGKSRIDKLKDISTGKSNLVIGTHSLIQDDVSFDSIGTVVIDEQHRFGVFQRLAFSNKGKKPNILVLSATPIPRTLALAAYGNMDESRITEKPIGRLPITTTSLTLSKEKKLIERLKIKLNKNEKAYWVCPLIEESEELDLKAAIERFNNLNKIFKSKVLLLHGQLKEKEKEEIMNKFKNENYKILVSTTVIEVGIDIKDATTIIIEHAERFGLAQLHQLRGRVGRNTIQSNCILLHKDNLTINAKKRIQKMIETNDGFEIAEKDLEIRGAGEVLGVKQSGMPSFKIADLSIDNDLLEDIRKKVEYIYNNDSNLASQKGSELKNLLHLFERDIALKTLKAG